MRTLFVALLAVPMTLQSAAAETATGCTHQLKTAKPGWEAYKTTDKLPVAGTFSKVTLTAPEPAGSVPDAIKGASMDIVAASVDSGLEVRNQTLAEHYFSKFAAKSAFRASVKSVEGTNESGNAVITVDVNGVSRDLTFPYTVSDTGELTAKATMDMMDFSLKSAFDAIHTACEALHMGPDGVSKTWTEVALSITATIEKRCP